MIKKVLYIDDDPDILTVVRYLLEAHHITCICCAGSQEAIPLALQHQPDLILLDAVLGSESLDCVVHALRAHPQIASLPMIAMTGKTDSSTVHNIRSLGFQGIVNKPFNPETLLPTLQSIIKSNTPPILMKTPL